MLAKDTDPELALLGGDPGDEFDITGEANHAIETAPIFTGDAFDAVGCATFPQRAVYGRILNTSTGAQVKSPKLYINTNAPFSGIVCGVQGSGKSHSTSVLLESCLIRDERLGTLPEPLSALLFHFDTAAGTGIGEHSPCEAACIASVEAKFSGDATPPRVVVLVLPNNVNTMRHVYSRLPNVEVHPLHFSPEDLSGDRMLAMMKVEQDQHMPLYIECIMSILRSMDTFSYDEFRSQLKGEKFSGTQKTMLDLRLSILDSCLEGGNASNCVSKHFKKGQLTIIDLSSPFMDASSACGFFDIILGLFIQAKTAAFGKLVVLDEAHKYLMNSGSSSRLTDSLLSVIRQQRHLGTRVVISTQEPTVVPSKFIDICSFVIAHRFSSQKWLDHLKEHISAVDTKWRSKVINLKPGEAMIFSPAALVLRQMSHDQDADTAHLEGVALLGQGYLTVRSRERITVDGGRSILAIDPSLYTQSMPLCKEESSSASPKSAADSVQNPTLSWESQRDKGQERPHTLDLRDSVRGSSLALVSDCSPSSSSSPVPSLRKSSTPGTTPVTSANVTISTQPVQNVEVNKPQTITAGSLNCQRVPDIGQETDVSTQAHSTPTPEIRFRPLIRILEDKAPKGQNRMSFSDLGTELRKVHHTPYKKLGEYLREAERANVVVIGGSEATPWVRLVHTGPPSCPREYVPLVNAMRVLLANGERQPRRSDVAMEIYSTDPGAVPGKFKTYISGAEAMGVVVTRKHDRLQLAI